MRLRLFRRLLVVAFAILAVQCVLLHVPGLLPPAPAPEVAQLLQRLAAASEAAAKKAATTEHDRSQELPVLLPPGGVLRVYQWVDPAWGWGERIGGALRRHAPRWVRWVNSTANADVELYHIVGRKEADVLLERPEGRDGATAPAVVAIQHVLTTGGASRAEFARAWARALLVVSFHDLDHPPAAEAASVPPRFHPMPWGADENRFFPPRQPQPGSERRGRDGSGREGVLIMGSDPFQEAHGEVVFAAAHANVRVRHVGDTVNRVCAPCNTTRVRNTRVADRPLLCQPLVALGGRAACAWHDHVGLVSDGELVSEMRRARYVATLRKFEGFEVGAVEGLFCGARPIVFNISSFRWHRDHAVLVPPLLPSEQQFDALQAIFRTPAPQVSREERARAVATFAWSAIVPQLYRRIAAELALLRGVAGPPST